MFNVELRWAPLPLENRKYVESAQATTSLGNMARIVVLRKSFRPLRVRNVLCCPHFLSIREIVAV